jgi:hypothetical protein
MSAARVDVELLLIIKEPYRGRVPDPAPRLFTTIPDPALSCNVVPDAIVMPSIVSVVPVLFSKTA